MEYHRLKPRFNTAAYDPKRISFVYVLSQNEGKGPYKVGMSKGDLWRRMSNYATAFVDFYVYYLVPVPYADVFAVERFMHRALPGRKAFPSETKERGNLSEWFDCSQRDLRRRTWPARSTETFLITPRVSICPVFKSFMISRNSS